MTSNTMSMIKSTVSKTRAMQTKSQTANKTQFGGPTIAGVQGIGKQSSVKRPMASQSTKAPRSQHTGLSGQFGEAKENEFSANQKLGQTGRFLSLKKPPQKFNQSNDYFSHMANKTSKTTVKEEALDESSKEFTDGAEWAEHARRHGCKIIRTGNTTRTQGYTNGSFSPTGEHRGTFTYNKKGGGGKGWHVDWTHGSVKEEALNEVKVGDHVHLGFGAKGGAGHRGYVTHVVGNTVHIEQHPTDVEPSWGGRSIPKRWKGPISHVTVEKSISEEALGEAKTHYDSNGRLTSHTIEAHGLKGFKRTPWRKTFKHAEHLNDWAEKNDAEVHGTRDLEAAKHGNLSPGMHESAPAMSIGSGQVAPIAPPDATANYALQQKNRRYYKQMLRRKQAKVK